MEHWQGRARTSTGCRRGDEKLTLDLYQEALGLKSGQRKEDWRDTSLVTGLRLSTLLVLQASVPRRGHSETSGRGGGGRCLS